MGLRHPEGTTFGSIHAKLLHLAPFALLTAAAGSAQTPPPAPVPASIAADLPAGANVIIYRAHAEPTVWGTTVKVDGKKIAGLGNKKWTAVTLAPGPHEITTSWSLMSGQSGGKLQLTVEPGRVHFLEITGTSRVDSVVAGAMTFRMGSGIAEVSGAAAWARVAACCSFKAPGN